MEVAVVWFLLHVPASIGETRPNFDGGTFYTTYGRCTKSAVERRRLEPNNRFHCYKGTMEKDLVAIVRRQII